MAKRDPHQAKDALTKRYIDSGNSPQKAREKAQKQLEGYDRRHSDKR